jgi:glutamine synthetase
MYSKSPEGQAARVPLPGPELQRLPDVQAMLMAMIDGIKNKIDPGSRSTATSTR